jgi:hypothetical protein
LAEEFQRRRLKYEKLTDDRQRTPSENSWKIAELAWNNNH